MKPFLSEARRQFLRENMRGYQSCPNADMISNFPEGEEDDHMAAHVACMIKAVLDPSMPEGEKELFLYNSSLCLEAIGEEAEERGLNTDHFPKGNRIMTEFTALHNQTRQ